MIRFEDWEQRLQEYLLTIRKKEFEDWGTYDCAIAWAGAIKAMTGEDLMEEYRGKYEDEAGALALIQASGYPNLAALLDNKLPRVVRSSAQRGDLGMLKGSGALCLVWGADCLAVGEDQVVGKIGVIRRPRADLVRTWKVG